MTDSQNAPYIHTGNKGNFNALVIDNSQQGPVLVNFCSGDLDACLEQNNILHKLVDHYDGLLLLVNIDVNEEADVCEHYGIASVPTIKLFRNGEVKESFFGDQSYEDLINIVELYIARPSDRQLADALEIYIAGDVKQAYDIITKAILNDPQNPRLPLTLCKLLKHEQRYDEAKQVIEALPDRFRNFNEISQFYNEILFFREIEHDLDVGTVLQALDDETTDLEIRKQALPVQVVQSQYDAALQNLQNMLDLDAKFADGYAYKAILRIIKILGAENPLTAQFHALIQPSNH